MSNNNEGIFVMKTKMLWMLVLAMVFAGTPAFAGEATQIWRCELEDDAAESDLRAMSGEWLTEAKKLPGGANLEAKVYFPVAVNATGEVDLLFVVTAPTFEEWGKFWDSYPGSAAAAMETKQNEFVICPDSSLWESVEVK